MIKIPTCHSKPIEDRGRVVEGRVGFDELGVVVGITGVVGRGVDMFFMQW